MDIPGFVTVGDVAAQIGRTDKRVYQLIKENKLEAVRLGREYLVRVKSVEKYLRARDGELVARKNGKKRGKR